MVQLIVGSKGKGKTKELLSRAAQAVKDANGTVVYVDKSSQHMYELSNRIRLINISNFPVNSEEGYISDAIAKIAALGENFGIPFVVSVSMDEHDLPESCKQYVAVAL